MLIWRAMVGGALGGIIWLCLPAILMGANTNALILILVWYAVFGFAITAALGALIGFAIWLINRTTRTPLRSLMRVVISVPIAFLGIAIYFLEQTPYRELSFWHAWYSIFFAVAVGLPAGLIAGRPTNIYADAAEQFVAPERN